MYKQAPTRHYGHNLGGGIHRFVSSVRDDCHDAVRTSVDFEVAAVQHDFRSIAGVGIEPIHDGIAPKWRAGIADHHSRWSEVARVQSLERTETGVAMASRGDVASIFHSDFDRRLQWRDKLVCGSDASTMGLHFIRTD